MRPNGKPGLLPLVKPCSDIPGSESFDSVFCQDIPEVGLSFQGTLARGELVAYSSVGESESESQHFMHHDFTHTRTTSASRDEVTNESSISASKDNQSHSTTSSSTLSESTLSPSSQSNHNYQTSLYANTLEFLPTTIFSAIHHNALSLGFDLGKISSCSNDCMSPFYQTNINPKTEPTSLTTPPTNIPVHLRPTLAQLSIPHHASLDLIPIPFLRERAIMLSAALPQKFNLWELKLDIYVNGGLNVWRCRQDCGGGDYQPWSMRSWEASPWFLNKWCMVVGGDEFRVQSGLWRTLRELHEQTC